MSKAVIIYESRWGNTKLAAEKIAEGMKQVSPVVVTVTDVKNFSVEQLSGYDAFVIGSPNHAGSATRNIGNLVNGLAGLDLKGKVAGAFDTCLKGDYEKVTKKLERLIGEKAPGVQMVTPGASVIMNGMKGPASESEQAKAVEFGKKIGRQLKK